MSEAGVEHWVQRFASEDARRDGTEPAWMRAARNEALERFRTLGFPTRRREEWKYTNVSTLARIPFAAAGPADGAEAALERSRALSLAEMAPIRLVFVGGRFAPELSRVEAAGEAVRVESLATALAENRATLEPILTRSEGLGDHSFAALNTAFFDDGAFVEVRAGATPPPIAVLFLGGGDGASEAAHPRIVVHADAGSHSTLIEAYTSRSPGAHLTNAVTQVVVAEGASLELVKLQTENEEGFHVSALAARLERDSRFTAWTLSLGSALTRNDLVSQIRGPGAECTLDGLYVPARQQHVDNHTLIDHRAPHGTSRELYQGILSGAARGVFHGKIVVQPDAQQTDARQRNGNLLLSDAARIDTKPELEIHADDVRCSHGSTIGHLEEEALFYLRSRGVGEVAARGILTRGFASAVTAQLPLACLREHVERLLGDRLSAPSRSSENA